MEKVFCYLLRYILGITWQDKVPNTKVMEATMSESFEAKMAAAQLRLAGHVSEYCMP